MTISFMSILQVEMYSHHSYFCYQVALLCSGFNGMRASDITGTWDVLFHISVSGSQDGGRSEIYDKQSPRPRRKWPKILQLQ